MSREEEEEIGPARMARLVANAHEMIDPYMEKALAKGTTKEIIEAVTDIHIMLAMAAAVLASTLSNASPEEYGEKFKGFVVEVMEFLNKSKEDLLGRDVNELDLWE